MSTAWIQTYTGKRFSPLEPNHKDICVEDVAHSLAMKCRFSGHTKEFYSVAQHSVLVSLHCNPKDNLWGLLHDASEAYLVDMPTPLKILPEFEWFRKAEDRVQAAVCKAFNLPEEQPESTHYADKVLLYTEKRDLMGALDWNQPMPYPPLTDTIVALPPREAKALFLQRYYDIMGYYNRSVQVTEW